MPGGPEDPFGNITRIAQGNTHTGTNTSTGFTYDTFGDLVEVIDYESDVRSISYNENGDQISSQYFHYPTDDRPPSQSQIDDPNVTFTAADYPPSRTLLRMEDDIDVSGDFTGSRTYVTEQTLDAATLTYIDGETTIRNESGSIEFDALGRVFRVTDENGRSSETIYDARGLAIETRIESPDEFGNGVWLVSRIVYDNEGRAVYSTGSFPEGTNPSQIVGSHTIYEPGTGRVMKTEQLLGIEIDLVASSNFVSQSSILSSSGSVILSSRNFYDDNDRVVETEDHYGLKSQVLYDSTGRVIESRNQVAPASGASQGDWLVSRTLFDSEGRVFASTDQFLVPAGTPLGGDPLVAVTTQITKTIYDNDDRVVATERYTGSLVGGLITSQELDVGPVGFQLIDEGSLETVSEVLYDAEGRIFRTISGRVLFSSLSATGLAQSQALASYPVYAGGVDRYANAGLSSGVISDTLFDDRGREYASLGHPLPASDLGLSSTSYSGNLVRTRYETTFNSSGLTKLSRSGLAQVETPEGVFVAVIDQNSIDSESRYDAFGNIYRTDLIAGGTISYDGTTKRTKRSGGSIQSYTLTRFDGEDRAVGEMQATTSDIVAQWSTSEESFVNAANGDRIPTKLYRYDTDDRLTAVELPAVPDPNNGDSFTRLRYEYSYDARGNQIGIVDPLGHETRFTFTDRDQQATRTLPLGFGDDGIVGTSDDAAAADFSESMTYDDLGRQRLHISFEGVVTENVYDGFGRMSRMNVYADEADYTAGLIGQRDEVSFDAYGRRSSWTRYESIAPTALATGVTSAVDDPNFSAIRTEATIFDSRGRLLHDISPEGTLSYDYDVQGRKTYAAIDAVIPAVIGSVGTPADPATADRFTSYAYDILGRLVGVTEDATPSDSSDDLQDTSYAFDLLGRKRTQLTFAPGDTNATVATSYVYDSLGRLDVMTDIDSSGNTLASYDYEVRADGKRTSSTEAFWFDENDDGVQDAGEVKTSTYDWTYDDAGRLTDEVLDHWDDAFDQTESFAYDLTGNRVSLERNKGNNGTVDEAITYSYDANDRLLDEVLDSIVDTDDITTSYSYDETQQTSKTVSRTIDFQPVTSQTFTYNLQGRMASVTNVGFDTSGVLNSRGRTSYDYDAGSFRVELTNETDVALDGNFTLSSRTEFLANSRNHTSYTQTIRETTFDADGNVTKTINYSFGDDEISQTVTDENGSATTHIFGHDGHGSVRVLYDVASVIAQAFTFTAYGQMLAVHNSLAVSVAVSDRISSLGYSGETFDAKVGQQYLRARFYNPSNGRFNRLDPFVGNNQDPQSLHKYGYVHGDPVQGFDPTGMFSVTGLLSAISIMAIGSAMPPGPSQVVQAMYEGLFNSAIANLNWDIEWAFNWDVSDSLHSHSDNSWVSLALFDAAMSVYEAWLDDLVTVGTIIGIIPPVAGGGVASAGSAFSSGGRIIRPTGGTRSSRSARRVRLNSGQARYSYSYTHSYKKADGTIGRSSVDYYQSRALGTNAAIRFKPSVVAKTVKIKPNSLGGGKRWKNASPDEIKTAKRKDLAAATAEVKRRNGGSLPTGWTSANSGRNIDINGVRHTWHHDVKRGRMQLVPQELHDAAKSAGFPGHVGQKLWH